VLNELLLLKIILG